MEEIWNHCFICSSELNSDSLNKAAFNSSHSILFKYLLGSWSKGLSEERTLNQDIHAFIVKTLGDAKKASKGLPLVRFCKGCDIGAEEIMELHMRLEAIQEKIKDKLRTIVGKGMGKGETKEGKGRKVIEKYEKEVRKKEDEFGKEGCWQERTFLDVLSRFQTLAFKKDVQAPAGPWNLEEPVMQMPDCTNKEGGSRKRSHSEMSNDSNSLQIVEEDELKMKSELQDWSNSGDDSEDMANSLHGSGGDPLAGGDEYNGEITALGLDDDHERSVMGRSNADFDCTVPAADRVKAFSKFNPEYVVERKEGLKKKEFSNLESPLIFNNQILCDSRVKKQSLSSSSVSGGTPYKCMRCPMSFRTCKALVEHGRQCKKEHAVPVSVSGGRTGKSVIFEVNKGSLASQVSLSSTTPTLNNFLNQEEKQSTFPLLENNLSSMLPKSEEFVNDKAGLDLLATAAAESAGNDVKRTTSSSRRRRKQKLYEMELPEDHPDYLRYQRAKKQRLYREKEAERLEQSKQQAAMLAEVKALYKRACEELSEAKAIIADQAEQILKLQEEIKRLMEPGYSNKPIHSAVVRDCFKSIVTAIRKVDPGALSTSPLGIE